MSAANSLQFNQLIGGAITPSALSSHQNGSATSAPTSNSSSAISPTSQQTQHLMIGDYVQGNMGNVLANNYRQQ